jgi:hypothetical protein
MFTPSSLCDDKIVVVPVADKKEEHPLERTAMLLKQLKDNEKEEPKHPFHKFMK